MNSATTGRGNCPLLIVQVDVPQEENTGDYYYRAYAPGVGMARCESVYTLNLTNVHRMKHKLMELADVLILNNICDADILPIVKERKKQGKLTVYELADDLADMPASNPRKEFYNQAKNLLLVRRFANYCDAVQFSSHELRRKYGYLNKVSVVFPNNILAMPSRREDEFPEPLVVGWGGSFGHFEDMKRVSAPLMDWVLSRSDVRLHLMCAAPIRELFERLPEERVKWFAPGSLEDYYRFVSSLHIGIAPLEDTPFNRSRSDVKFLEYAAHGVVPILQATGPYVLSVKDGETGFLYRSLEELISILDKLAGEPSMRIEAARGAREYVQSERDQLRRGGDRVEFYRELLSGAVGNHAQRVFEECCKLAGAQMCGRNLFLGSTRFELLLINGLMLLGKGPACWEMFREAMAMEPTSYMPCLFGAGVSDDPVGFLEKAVRNNPRSIVSWLSLAWEWGRKSDSGRAMQCFKTAADLFPEYEQPYIECANYLNGIGMTAEAMSLLKVAVSVIPEAIKSIRPS
ncbi:MAG: hypothetical protein P4L55_06600 [Syntrophobacteraceae bacterium]|nr:hypothetical protein [Syntrophobacteraceae bacterium]